MKQFTKLNIKQIPIEEAHGGAGSRQVLVKPEHLTSQHFEAVTKGFLKPNETFDWHSHENTDEVFIVIKGIGKFSCGEDSTDYQEGDVIIIPANLNHKIEAAGDEVSEYYFIRVKS